MAAGEWWQLEVFGGDEFQLTDCGWSDSGHRVPAETQRQV